MEPSVANATDAADEFAERVASHRDELAPAERRVADRLLDLGPPGTLLSAAAIAELLGTSDATVVRTAKALGYRGLADLRRALAAQGNNPPPGERLRRTLEQTSGDELFASVIGGQLSALDSLSRDVSPTVFQDAVTILARSDRVVWRGVGPSAYLAGYGQMLTQRIGRPSSALVHTGTSFADELLTLARNDAVVVFAYGRLQSHVQVLLDRAAALEAPIVLITDTLGRKLKGAVSATLQSGRGAPGLFASHGTTLVVIEALVLALAATDRARSDASLTALNELRAALAGRRIDVDTP
ncbi:MAG TPA: MurR/RpiR family transcriptional regulator [Acidimicrobiia bacterium]